MVKAGRQQSGRGQCIGIGDFDRQNRSEIECRIFRQSAGTHLPGSGDGASQYGGIENCCTNIRFRNLTLPLPCVALILIIERSGVAALDVIRLKIAAGKQR